MGYIPPYSLITTRKIQESKPRFLRISERVLGPERDSFEKLLHDEGFGFIGVWGSGFIGPFVFRFRETYGK